MITSQLLEYVHKLDNKMTIASNRGVTVTRQVELLKSYDWVLVNPNGMENILLWACIWDGFGPIDVDQSNGDFLVEYSQG